MDGNGVLWNQPKTFIWNHKKGLLLINIASVDHATRISNSLPTIADFEEIWKAVATGVCQVQSHNACSSLSYYLAFCTTSLALQLGYDTWLLWFSTSQMDWNGFLHFQTNWKIQTQRWQSDFQLFQGSFGKKTMRTWVVGKDFLTFSKAGLDKVSSSVSPLFLKSWWSSAWWCWWWSEWWCWRSSWWWCWWW